MDLEHFFDHSLSLLSYFFAYFREKKLKRSSCRCAFHFATGRVNHCLPRLQRVTHAIYDPIVPSSLENLCLPLSWLVSRSCFHARAFSCPDHDPARSPVLTLALGLALPFPAFALFLPPWSLCIYYPVGLYVPPCPVYTPFDMYIPPLACIYPLGMYIPP